MTKHGNRHRHLERWHPKYWMRDLELEAAAACGESALFELLLRRAERRVFTPVAAAQALLDAGLVTSVDVDGYFE